MVSAVVWLVAEVAFTVTELVPGGVPLGPPPVVPPLLPPQLPRRNAKTMAAQSRATRRAVRRPRNRTSRSALKQLAEMKAQKRGPGARGAKNPAAEGAVVVRVRVVEIGLMPGVSVAGEKLQLAAAGNPLQEKPIVDARSPTGLMVILKLADWPLLTVAF